LKFLYLLATLTVLCALAPGCGPEELESVARDRAITVDGDVSDWQGILEFLDKGNLSYGLANDAESMYIVLVVGDRAVRRQIIMSGLYLWFDAAGGEDRRFGLRFPIGLLEDATDMTPLFREQDPNRLSESFDETVTEFMVIGPHDESWRRSPVDAVGGIETAAKADPNRLVLEFRVPVTNDGQYGYGIGALPGAVVGFGLETPKVDIDDMRGEMRSARGGPGMGGWGGGGMGGGMGGPDGAGPPHGGRAQGIPDPIKVWTRVHLARGAAGDRQ
jgi:hypothetical protein